MENHEDAKPFITREIQWFMETLKKEFHIRVESKEIALEATELGMDEVDNSYIPSELFASLPETFLYEIMIVDDEYSNEWIGAIAFHPDTPEWCLQLILKNGDLLIRKLLPKVE
ncbi:hypothetical protein QMA04_00255 [Planococcus sp. APC 3900]|uniref:hypothetical protein n=1 Tax=Planococcus sp. APC 3900 TaxID=3035191 RepID=UPI0025B2A5D5|nr:hypothetical protein [Planococcus sp. APC 3900]MDN3436496.1 hypothetical protein [Planococcus sp. APC 3900]